MTIPRQTSDVRDGILDAAEQLFIMQGYRATGVNQIIRKAGVAKASFYHHFPSKTALAEAFIQRRHKRWFRAVEQRLALEEDPRDKLLALFELWTDQIRDEGFRGCLFVNMAAEFPDYASPIRQRIKAHKESVWTLIASLLSDYAASRKLTDAWTPDADTIYLLYDGALVETQNFQADWPIHSAKRTVARLLAEPAH